MSEERLCSGEDHKTLFSGKAYLDDIFSEELNPVIEQTLMFLHDCYIKDPTQNGRLLDIGSGPAIYHVISASRCYSSITCSDYTPDAYAQIQKWLRRDADAFDWTSMFQRIAALEGDESKWPDLEKRTRAAIKTVIPCDIRLPEPLMSHPLDAFDCVQSTLCLEAACTTKQAMTTKMQQRITMTYSDATMNMYKEAVERLASLLRPGGRLVMVGVLQQSVYEVGGVKFSCLSLTRPDVEGAVEAAGLIVEDYRSVADICDPVSDCCGVFYVAGLKQT